MTNREYLESLDDVDLAEKICDWFSEDCQACPAKQECVFGAGHGNGLRTWLKQEAEEE